MGDKADSFMNKKDYAQLSEEYGFDKYDMGKYVEAVWDNLIHEEDYLPSEAKTFMYKNPWKTFSEAPDQSSDSDVNFSEFYDIIMKLHSEEGDDGLKTIIDYGLKNITAGNIMGKDKEKY